MKGLRSKCGISLSYRVRNERIRERCGWDRYLISRYDQSILKWYGYVMRMNEDRLVRRVLDDVVEGNRGRGRPKRKWMDKVREAMGRRRIVEDRREIRNRGGEGVRDMRGGYID